MIKGYLKSFAILLLLALVAFSCGKGVKQNFLALGGSSVSQGADEDSEFSAQLTDGSFGESFPSSLPEDKPQPWEKLDEQGFVIPQTSSGQKSPSAINLETDFTLGANRFLEAGDVTDYQDASRLRSGSPGGRALSYALYRISLGPAQPGVISVDANLHLKDDGSLSEYYVAVSNYGARSWKWWGPFTDNHVRISLPPGRYTSSLGNTFVAVAVFNGGIVDVVGIGINKRNESDTTPPPAPSPLSATPVPGGILLEWTPVIAEDLAGYKIYYASYEFSSPTQRGVKAVSYLEGMTRRVLGDQDLKPRLRVGSVPYTARVSSVDTSGNESELSPIASATLLDGNLPPVNLETSVISGSYGTQANLTATGAETYDFDLDGDGTFEITDNSSGSASATLNTPGIIRPAVRGRTAEGGIAFSAVSLIVSVNSRPVASANANPSIGSAPLVVNFTGTGADDDGTIVSYAWDFDGDGTFDYQDQSNPNPPPQVYNTPGLYNVKFRVEDNKGSWDVDTIAVQVLEGASAEAQIEEANQTFRDEVASAMMDAASLFGKEIETSNFVTVLSEEGYGIAVNSFIRGADSLTIDELASGADVLFTFVRLPAGSSVPSGFYVVRLVGQNDGTWLAQFIDQAGAVAFETTADVGYGDAKFKIPEATIEKTVFQLKNPQTGEWDIHIEIKFDWHWVELFGSTNLVVGTGGPDPTPLTPEGLRIVSSANNFRSIARDALAQASQGFAGMSGPADINLDSIMIASRDDLLLAYAPFVGIEDIAPEDDDVNLLFGYFRGKLQSGFIYSSQTSQFLQMRRKSISIIVLDRAGQEVARQKLEVGEGTGQAKPIFTIKITPEGFVIDLHIPLVSFIIGEDYYSGWEDEAIEYANAQSRAARARVLEDVASRAGILVDSQNFIAGYNGDASIVGINAALRGIEKKDIGRVAEGEDMLLIFLRIPQDSQGQTQIPTGFYIAHIYQDMGTRNWYAQLRNAFTGEVVLTTDALVSQGDSKMVGAISTTRIVCCPLQVIVDWHTAGTIGEFSILVGDAPPDTPTDIDAIRILRHVRANITSISEPFVTAARAMGKGIKMKDRFNLRLSLISTDSLLGVVGMDEDYVSGLTQEEVANGADLFFAYLRRPGRTRYSNIVLASFYDSDGDGIGVVSFKDENGQTVDYGLGELGPGSGSPTPTLNLGADASNLYINLATEPYSLTIKTKSSPP